MSCPLPKTPPSVEVLSVTVHPDRPCLGEEELAGKLHAEQLAHDATRQSLARATRELHHLRAVHESAEALAALTTVSVCTPAQEEELQKLFARAVFDLLFTLAWAPQGGEQVRHG